MTKNASPTDREIRNDLREMRNELKAMKEAMDEVKALLLVERNEREALKKENDELRAQCASQDSVIQELRRRVVHCEQYSRRSNLEIQGLVETEDENIIELVGKIGGAIEESILPADIEVCHRVPTREPGKTNVVVQFKSRQKRDIVLEKARTHRVKNSELGLSSEAQIFLNEHLCPALKRLLSLAIGRKRQCQWRFVWTRNGKIFARQSEGSGLVRIETDRDLSKIC